MLIDRDDFRCLEVSIDVRRILKIKCRSRNVNRSLRLMRGKWMVQKCRWISGEVAADLLLWICLLCKMAFVVNVAGRFAEVWTEALVLIIYIEVVYSVVDAV